MLSHRREFRLSGVALIVNCVVSGRERKACTRAVHCWIALITPLEEIQSGLQDQTEEVRYSAAAAVIHLTDLSARRAPAKRPPTKPAPKKK
jgi:hypothetical protein